MDFSILYVDGDLLSLNTFAELFGGTYDVRIASTLAQARQMLRERPVEIVISAQRLPEINGQEFLGEIAREYPISYRVILIGNSVMYEIISAADAGVIDAIIAKPLAAIEMRSVLERARLIVNKRQLCKLESVRQGSHIE